MIDAFYYSTVTVTTTGYGDIRPETDSARLVTTLLVTPARVLFLILLVGTTLEILAERTRTAYRLARWRRNLHDHTIVCGYGTKGRTAISTLLGQGSETASIIVIDPDAERRAAATAAGLAAVAGEASAREVLEEAGIADARAVVIAVDRDDSAVLIALTARELAPNASIVAAVREQENVHLLHRAVPTRSSPPPVPPGGCWGSPRRRPSWPRCSRTSSRSGPASTSPSTRLDPTTPAHSPSSAIRAGRSSP